MDLATRALGSLLPKLAKLLQDEYKLHKSVKGDVLFLTEELESMRAAFLGWCEVPTEQLDPIMELWARDVEQLSYYLERVVDTSLLRVEGSDPPNQDNSRRSVKKLVKLFQNCKNRRESSEHIKHIRSRFQEIIERHPRILRHHVAVDTARIATLYREQSQLVGIDELTEDLVRSLTNEDAMFRQQLKIVCIVGFAGVGKTTLANAVYQKLRAHFSCRAFVSLGPNPDVKTVFKTLLSRFAEDVYMDIDKSCLDERHLLDLLREFLHDKRYFVVVDDIWDLQVWDAIKCAFIESSNKSLVLVTTRSVGIAKIIGRLYRLPPLSETYSRMLFYKRVFGSEGTCPPELADKFEKFIAMCCGIPLAIIVCSSFLVNRTKEDWHAVHDPFLYQNSDPYLGSMRAILALSYTYLPPHLKSCLLYLSMFPKDYDISGERLVWGWIAEGFIEETEGTTLHELGESYLHELINRSLIEPEMVDAGGKVLSCRVHSLMHGFITSLSTGNNFSTTYNGAQSINLEQRINRLSIHRNDIEGEYSMPQAHLSDMRSLVVSGDANVMPSLSDFQQLRVLDLGSCDALQNDHLKGIDKSPLLKYVVIGGNCITRLPNEIVKLKLLQTLDLRESGLNELPEIVFWLTSLKCLYVNNHMKIPDGIGKMKALQELGDINICKPETLLRELSNLDKLSVLRIAIWSWNERLVSSHGPVVEYLRSLCQNIRSLSISTSCSLDFMDNLGAEWAPSLQTLETMYSPFHKLPSWIDSLPQLSSLSVEVYKLTPEIINTLGKFSTLSSLSLTTKHAPGGEAVIGTDEFPSLTGFHFASNAMRQIFAPGAMKTVERLKLSFQASRTEDVCGGFDFGLQNLHSLKHVRIEINCFNATHQVVERAEAAIRKQIPWGLEIRRVREEDMIKEVVEQDRVTAFLARRKEMRN